MMQCAMGAIYTVMHVYCTYFYYSHSIVAGGFDVMSYATRFTPGTSATMRLEIRARTSYGSFAQSAVMASLDSTARKITGRA